MPRIPDVFLKSIVFLYPTEDSAMRGGSGGGSGFLVDQAGSRVLLTNIHVAFGGCRYARVPLLSGGFTSVEIPERDWVSHVDGDDVAGAIWKSNSKWDLRGFDWRLFAATRARLDELNVGVGDEIVMFGRFVTVGGVQINQPLARFGNIALMPGEKVMDARGVKVEAYLVELRSLSGFSGSPVFVYIAPATYRGEGKMMPFYQESIGLIGIDTGHISINSPVVQSDGGATGTVQQNSGLTIVSPVWKIADVVEELTRSSHTP